MIKEAFTLHPLSTCGEGIKARMTGRAGVRGLYSVLKLFTGFASAALTAWKLMVAKAISNASIAANKNTHHAIFMR